MKLKPKSLACYVNYTADLGLLVLVGEKNNDGKTASNDAFEQV